MGVDGFLRQLNNIIDETHLTQFTGQTLVVDALSWLYKACYGCAYELSTGKDTDKYIQYMVRKVDMMHSYGVAKVILVFDGQRLPLKSSTQEKRQRHKEENRQQALHAMAFSQQLQGRDRQNEVKKAYQLFQRSVTITRQIISSVMNALRAAGIPFVVAPFEADAQMVWMCKEGVAAGIVTEDSDVVVYCLTANVSCPVLVKLEGSGAAQVVSRSILHKNSAKYPSNAMLRKICFLTSGEKDATRMFVQVCVLAGCDFINSLPNMGFATAVKHIFNFRGAPGHLRVQRLVSKLSSSGTNVPSDFMQKFVKAETIFFHHIIYNPHKRCCELLVNEKHINCFPDILQRAKESLDITSKADQRPSDREEDLHALATATNSFLGKVLSREVVENIYKGQMCARTLCSLSNIPTTNSSKQKSLSGSQNGKLSTTSCQLLRHGHSHTMNQGLSAMVTQGQVSQLSTDATVWQSESKKRSQANECAVSLQGLMNVYKSATVTALPSAATDASVSSASSILSTTVSIVKSSKVTTMSMPDLISKHSQSIVPVPTSLDIPELCTTAVPSRRDFKTRKRLRPVPQPDGSSKKKKTRPLVDKQLLGNRRKTLFDFFPNQ